MEAFPRTLVLILVLLQGAISQSHLDLVKILENHPGCFHKGFQYTPAIPNTNQKAQDVSHCQQMCRDMTNCHVFAFFPSAGDCHFGDWNARMVETSSDAIAGYGVCPEPTAEPPALCRTEAPQNGFPGISIKESQMAWPSGRQPWSLACWPKNSTGGYIPCQAITVLEDTGKLWPGKCRGLTIQDGITYDPAKPATEGACKQSCIENPLCPGWQIGTGGQCWQGLGERCYVRNDYNPVTAQRIQHGEVRVLMDLAGWQIVGLYKMFDNMEGYFLEEKDAAGACKAVCYSDIRCQYWQYAPKYGCYVEDESQEFHPPYPLTLDWAYRNTDFALHSIAGEFIQHYCPNEMTTMYPSTSPAAIASCMKRGYVYEPDMTVQSRTVELSAESCQARCRNVLGCSYFAYWPDGGCHLQGYGAQYKVAPDAQVVSGPPSCDDTTATPAVGSPQEAAGTNWLTSEGQAALGVVPIPSTATGLSATTAMPDSGTTNPEWATADLSSKDLGPAPSTAGATPVQAITPEEAAGSNWLTSEGQEALGVGAIPGAPEQHAAVKAAEREVLPLAESSAFIQMAELLITLQNLNYDALTESERTTLEEKYAVAISKGIDVDINAITDKPHGNPALVTLQSQPPASSQIVAYAPNTPPTSLDTSKLAASLKQPSLAQALMNATNAVAPQLAGTVSVTDQMVTMHHQIAGEAPKVSESSFWGEWWPLLLALGLLVCGGCVLAAVMLYKPSDKAPARRRRGGLEFDQDATTSIISDVDSEEDEGDAGIWESDPAWDTLAPPPPPARGQSMSEYQNSRGQFTV